MGNRVDLVPGTLDMMVMKAVSAEGLHGFGVARSIGGVPRGRLTATLLGFVLGCSGAGAQQVAEVDLVGLWTTHISYVSMAGGLVLQERGQRWTVNGLGFTEDVDVQGESVRFEVRERGFFRGAFARLGESIEGQWVQPATDVTGAPYATPVELLRTGPKTYTGTLRPLEAPYLLFLLIDRDEQGDLRAVFRNPNRNHRGTASQYRVRAAGTSVTFEPVTGSAPALDAQYSSAPGRLSLEWGQIGRDLVLSKTQGPAIGFWPRSDRAQPYSYRTPTAGEDGWDVGRARDHGIDEGLLTQLVMELGSADPRVPAARLVHSVSIAHRGELVLDEYFFGYEEDMPHDLRSGSKSFTSLMFGIAADQVGLHPDDSVDPFFPDRAKGGGFEGVTVGHLLSHTSGLACDDNDSDSPGNESTMQRQTADDWYSYTLALPRDHPPGEHYAYCTAGMNLVGGVVRAAIGGPLPEFFRRAVAVPLGIDTYHMNLMPDGLAYSGGGIHMRPRDFLKLGQLYLDRGVWNGTRVVSEDWVRLSTAPQADPNNPLSDGYGWHRVSFEVDGRIHGGFEANGNGGQFIIVLPSLELVIGFTGGNYGMYGVWRQFREDLVPRLILPAVRPR